MLILGTVVLKVVITAGDQRGCFESLHHAVAAAVAVGLHVVPVWTSGENLGDQVTG